MRFRYLIACTLLALPLLAFGQAITGVIRGTVTDTSGAVVPNASVSVINTDTKLTRNMKTNGAGEYAAPLLPVGNYDVLVEAQGFTRYQKSGLVLNANDRLTVDAQLKTGSAAETVNVEANPVQVNLQNAAVEGLIDGQQVRQLPLNNRNYEQLVTLQPGVTSNAADQIYVGTTNPSGQVNIVSFSINGNRQSQNNWTIDGSDNVDHGSNITLLVYPSVDAIAEFKVERSNYNPEFGRSASGQINVVTRSGTNMFHGSAYEFFRNDWLNANNSYNNHYGVKRPVLRYNDFGGTIGGPFYIPGHYNTNKDKTFFFFSEELRRVTTPVTQTSFVPTQAQFNGHFNHPVCTAINAAGDCTATGTTITAFDPVYSAYLKDVFSKIPAPDPTSNKLVSSFPGVFNYREELIRVDQVINSKITVMGRYVNDSIPTTEPFGIFGPQSSIPGVANTSTNSPGRQIMGKGTIQFSPSLLNEVGYAYSYGAIESYPTGSLSAANSPNVASAVKLPYKSTLARIPNILFDDNFSSLAGFGQYLDYNRNHEVFDNLSWIQGKHNFKFGFSYNHYQKKENAAGDNVGNYEFDSTNSPGSASDTEQDLANFMLGYISSDFSQSPLDTTADVRQQLWEFYGQDEWRVLPNLTISYGLRYSLFPTPYNGSGSDVVPITSFDPAVYDKTKAPQLTASGALVPNTGNLLNGIITGDKNSPYGKYITSQDHTNFAPRLGLAWDPFKNGKTSVRAGFGMFYDSVAAGLIEDNVFNNPPYIANSDFGGGYTTSNIGNAGAIAATYPSSIWTTAPNWHTPYSEQWSLSVQQELGHGWIAEIGYVGNKGTHLVGVQDINQVYPGVAQAAGLVTPGAVYGCATPAVGCSTSSRTAAARKLNPYRPYVGWQTIGQIAPQFDSNYNALQTSVAKRFSGNYSLVANYTWSHGLTDNQTDRSSGLQNTYCRICDYGRAQIDRRHVFTGSFVYDTPWYSKQDGLAGHLFGGYQFSGIVTVNSGLPLTIFANRNWGDPAASGVNTPGAPNNGSVATPRPNQVADPNGGGAQTWLQWFNPSAFVVPTTGTTYGGSERRGAVNGPGLWRVDFSMTKSFKITERTNFQFRAEAFNIFNHTNFSTVGTSLPQTPTASSTYNQITGTRDPRILQFAGKFTF